MQKPEQDLHKYDRQLKQGFASLRFEDSMEKEFRAFFYTRSVVKQRGAIIVGIILLLGLMPFDLGFLSGAAQDFYLLSRAWITIPVLMLALFLTFKKKFIGYFSVFSFFIILFIGISTSVLVVYTQNLGQYSPYEGIMLIIMVAFSLGGMLFRQSLSCIILVGLCYLVLSELMLSQSPYLMHQYYFLFATCLIGGVSGYMLEYQTRIAFLQRGALRNLAKTDPLTGLFNRGAINQKLNDLVEYAYREQKPLSLLMLDVDYFKNFNDHYGHLEGDDCLVDVASRLSDLCKRPLDFAGRYGGEEFILVWFDAPTAEATTLAQNTRNAIRAMAIPHQTSKVSDQVTVSGGLITGIPTSPDLQDTLLHQADQCLYRAKESGRNRIAVQSLGESNSLIALIK